MNELYHHGVKGQKWGVRRYQNPDGSLTAAGKRRFKRVVSNEKKQQLHTKRAKFLLEGNSENNKISAREIKESYKKGRNISLYKENVVEKLMVCNNLCEKLKNDIKNLKI